MKRLNGWARMRRGFMGGRNLGLRPGPPVNDPVPMSPGKKIKMYTAQLPPVPPGLPVGLAAAGAFLLCDRAADPLALALGAAVLAGDQRGVDQRWTGAVSLEGKGDAEVR